MSEEHDEVIEPQDELETHEEDTSDDAPELAEARRPASDRVITTIALVVVALVVGFALGRSPASEPEAADETHEGHDHAESAWTCSMHPQIQSPEPGACPICGMDLIPASEAGGKELDDAQVELSARAKALARIRTTAVTSSAVTGDARELFGRVVQDEGSTRAVTSWISGRVDRLLVSTTGEKVRRGQTLATIYSPEVYAAHKDLLVGVAQLARLSDADPIAKHSAEGQLESARQRLRLLGFTGAELAKMERAEKPWTQVSIRSRAAGVVHRRLVSQGEYVARGAQLLELTRLNKVWVELDAYESDLDRVEPGQEVTLRVDALPDETIVGTIAFVDHMLDARTRVTTLRVEVDNPGMKLKPGMYVRASMEPRLLEPGEPFPLVIPKSAPLHAGERSLVYVEVSSSAEGSIYEAREVVLGEAVGANRVVRAGLARGERVVTHGAFALDSDLQIRGKLSLMARGDDESRTGGAPMLELDDADREALRPVLLGYLDVQEKLANDELAPALALARGWQGALAGVSLDAFAASEAWAPLSRRLTRDVDTIVEADSLTKAREAFSSATEVLDEALARFGNVLDEPIRKAYCPMANEDRGDHWYQRAEKVDNVYFGNEMRRCGEIQRVVDAGEYVMLDTSGGRP